MINMKIIKLSIIMCMFLLFIPMVIGVNVPDGGVSYWNFCNVKDKWGSNEANNIQGTCQSDYPYFNSSGDSSPDSFSYSDTSDGTDLPIGDSLSNNMSVSGYMKFNAFLEFSTLLDDWDGDDGDRNYLIGLDGSGDGLRIMTGEPADGTQKSLTWSHDFITGKWYHVGAKRVDGDLTLYVNGTKVAHKDTNYNGQTTPQTANTGVSMDGYIDDLKVFDRGLTDEEFSNLYNCGEISCGIKTIALNYPENNLHSNEPLNSTFWYESPDLTSANCSLFINDTLNKTHTVMNNTNHSFITNFSQDTTTVNWKVGCSNGTKLFNTTERTYVYDTVKPYINNSIKNDSYYINELPLNVSYQDKYLYQTNTTIIKESNNNIMYNDYKNFSNEETGIYELIENINLSDYTEGKYNIMYEASDSHTKNKFKETPKQFVYNNKNKGTVKNTFDLKHGNFNIIHNDNIKTYYSKDYDRIKFHHEFNKESKQNQNIIIEAKDLTYLPYTDYRGHFIINNKYWYDVEGINLKKIKKLNKNRYKLKFKKPENKNKIITKSLGGLNFNSKNVTFTVDKTEPYINSYDFESYYNYSEVTINFSEEVIFNANSGLNCDGTVWVMNQTEFIEDITFNITGLNSDTEYKLNLDYEDKAGNTNNNCYSFSTTTETVTGTGEVNIYFQESPILYLFFGLIIWGFFIFLSVKINNDYLFILTCLFGILFGFDFYSDSGLLNLISKFFMIINGVLIWFIAVNSKN